MGQLVVFLARLRQENGIAIRFFSFRVGRRDEADFVVEDAEQVVKILGTVAITRENSFQPAQLLAGP